MMRQVNIGTRLGIGFTVILALMATMLTIMLVSGEATRVRIADTQRDAAETFALAHELEVALLDSAVAVRGMALQTTVEEVQRDEAEAKRRRADAVSLRQQLEARVHDAAERESLQQLAHLDGLTGAQIQAAVDLLATFNTEQAAAIITHNIDPLLRQTKTELKRFVTQQQKATSTAIAATTERAVAIDRLVSVCAIVVVAFSTLLAWRLTVSITVPLSEAEAATQRVAAGDLSTVQPISGGDEAARLLKSLQQMQSKLADVVGRVRRNSESVSSASVEIAAGNNDLSVRTEKQSSTLQQTAASMEQLGAAVRHNANNATQANQLAIGASDVARRGGDVISEVVETMHGITESSRRIGDIIGVIDGIAFQTNILALNAAVEAARAGEQGRGFAVVAGEVRTLAQRSAEAAREIKALIAASVARVERGTELVDRAGATMNEIVGAVGSVTDIMGKISSASMQQSEGVTQVGQAIGQIDTTTQQNAALVEQSAAAAESLKIQARELVDAVSVFRL